MNVTSSVDPVDSVEDIQELLAELTGLDGTFNVDVETALRTLLSALGTPDQIGLHKVESHFYGRLNQKLSLNQSALATLYSLAAKAGVTFNYPTKKAISWAVDSLDADALSVILGTYWPAFSDHPVSLEELGPFRPEQTRRALQDEAVKPSKLRKAHDRQVLNDVFNAAAGPLVWSLWEAKTLHQYFQEQGGGMPYSGEYLQDLQLQSPELFNRDHALSVAFVGREIATMEYPSLRDRLTRWLASEYAELDNYGFVSLVIDTDAVPAAWQLACDLVLFAEHFIESRVRNKFFRWQEVMQETVRHIPHVDTGKADFEIANEGYTYRDQFVLTDAQGGQKRIVLLMQKNRRDETPIPCPACRSSHISGNSYPTLGVKSWECSNVLCPERSIYNRGKRYSFKALLAQEAIEHPSNEIPVESVRRWQRDVLPFTSDGDVLDMLVRHYSMVGDGVAFYGAPQDAVGGVSAQGRELDHRASLPSGAGGSGGFWNSALFARFPVAPPPRGDGEGAVRTFSGDQSWQVIHGDSLRVLAAVAEATFDRAITSPPYFNAREYSQWPNLYCYLHDMQAIAQQVFRVLKPGALYAYNIFDTFDNERIITFSDMGKKRISLSAWTVDAFRRVGFQLLGNLVWDKGEIHGKRGFNAGNFSPFYQSPFNCWEHVLLFHKPDGTGTADPAGVRSARQVARIHPVVKMVRGENRHGHTAPFPQALPERLLDGLPAESLILDPFGGSGTTARAALSMGMRAVMIEQDASYVSLSRRLIEEHERGLGMTQQTLFAS